MVYCQSYHISGCSAVGSAPALGAGCRRFESCHSDHIRPIILIHKVSEWSVFLFVCIKSQHTNGITICLTERRRYAMRKIYFDTTEANMCISIYVRDTQVIPAGVSVNAMSVKHKNNTYQIFADKYDIHFIFADDIPKVDFYTVPMVDIFATDRAGGYIGSVGQSTDLEANIPICYIDTEKKCYLIAANGNDFLNRADNWKAHLSSYNEIEFFDSPEMAQKKFAFLDRSQIEQMQKNAEQKT